MVMGMALLLNAAARRRPAAANLREYSTDPRPAGRGTRQSSTERRDIDQRRSACLAAHVGHEALPLLLGCVAGRGLAEAAPETNRPSPASRRRTEKAATFKLQSTQCKVRVGPND